MQAVTADGLYSPESLPDLPDGEWYLAGNGCALHERFPAGLRVKGRLADIHPHAADVAALAADMYRRGGAKAAADAMPVYLRDEVWQKLPGR